MSNQFIKPHTKDNNKINKHSLKLRIPKLHKSDISQQIWTGKPVYSEEIKKNKNTNNIRIKNIKLCQLN